MITEVELKAPCENAREKVQSLGAKFVNETTQIDTYYRHPSRDFKITDEALRIRQEDKLYITYKGPKMDSLAKARVEIEFEVPEDAKVLLTKLGFEQAFVIEKKRANYELDGLKICCDEVVGLGEYVEVESDKLSDLENIKDVLSNLGVLEDATTKSYSELLGI